MSKEIIEKIKQFREERDWKKFHTPENLAKSISIESGELLECFQWEGDNFILDNVKDEIADIYIYLTLMAEDLNLELDVIAEEKLKKNKEKYPISKSKGKSTKYNKL